MRRWRQRYQEHGYDGLYDYRKRQPSPKRIPTETLEEVLGLYREKYVGFNVRHFHEKLREEHDIRLSYSWVKLALQDPAGNLLLDLGPFGPLARLVLCDTRGVGFWTVCDFESAGSPGWQRPLSSPS